MAEIAPNPIGLQIKPDLENILRSDKVKELIQKRLTETLLDKTYSVQNVQVWTKQLSDLIIKDLAESNPSARYKHIVQVVIIENLGQGYKMISRARWDSECDRQVSESFSNDSLICIATVFGCYLY